MPSLLELELDPVSAYKIAVENCFAYRKEGPAVEALALVYLWSFIKGSFGRLSPEFEAIIDLEGEINEY